MEGSPLNGLDLGVEMVAVVVLVVADDEAFVVGQLEAGEGDDVFVFINGSESVCVWIVIIVAVGRLKCLAIVLICFYPLSVPPLLML